MLTTFRNFLKAVYRLYRTTFYFVCIPSGIMSLYYKPTLQFTSELYSFCRTAELVI